MVYLPLTFNAVVRGHSDITKIFSTGNHFKEVLNESNEELRNYKIFKMKTQMSDRDVFFNIQVPNTYQPEEDSHSNEPQAMIYVFNLDNKDSFEYISNALKNEKTASLPATILCFPCSKKKSKVSDSEIKGTIPKNMIYTEVTIDDEVKIVKVLTKIGRILRSEHERKIEAMRPDASEVHNIVKSGDLKLLEFCLFGDTDPLNSKARSAINSKDRRGMTPLHLAVTRGSLEIVEFLARSGCNLNSKDKDQSTALHLAAYQGHISIAQTLIFQGISASAREKSGLSYVGVAAREGNTAFLKKAITDWDADPLEIKDLDLTGRQLKELPDFPWGKLENLRTIDLSGNNLDVIPVAFIHLPQLEKVFLEGNPLRSIPERFRSPWPVLRDYIGSVGTKASRWTEKKLLFVGQEGVGKTTLLKSLRSRRHKVSCKENLSTDGIDVHENIAIDAQSTVSFSAWDFGGQEVYYPSHQFFLTSNSIYIIVFDLSDDDVSRVEYWMKQIMVMNNSTQSPIIIVGTHMDDKKCTPEYVEEKIASLNQRFPKYRHLGFQCIIPVSCKNGQGMKKLIDLLYELIENEPFPILPDSWVYFHEYLNSYKKKLDYVQWSVYTGWARRCGVDMSEIYKCTDFLSDVGSLIYFNDTHGKLNDLVILNPQFLADLMSTLITFRHSWVKEGKLALTDLPQVLSRFDATLADSLLALLERFQIIHKVKGSKDYMVPSLLPNTLSKLAIFKAWPTEAPPAVHEFRRQYKFQFLPLGFFSRLMLRILHIPGMNGVLYWRDGFILSYKEQYAQVLFDPRSYVLTIAVRVSSKDHFPGMLLRNLVESVESLINGFYARVKDMVDRYVPCTHCVKFFKNLREPYNFTYAECIAAIILGKTYIFCQNILSPSRCVRIEQLAPDIGFADIHLLDSNLLEIDTQLGQGGFGVVYKGVYKQEPVAIKELKFLLGNDEERVQKFREFQQEAWIMSLLDHPNVVRMLGCTVNPLRMVLELVEEGDLFAFMHPKVEQDGKRVMVSKKQCEVPWDLRFKIILDIAVGMRHLHHGVNPPIIHRDLRSPNIFLESVDKNSEVCAKVADFGLAAMVMPDIAGALGTWQWLAPEVIDRLGSTYDCRSDVYSFGIVFWELCSFEIPFLEYLPLEEYSCLVWDHSGNEIRQFNPEAMKDAIMERNLRPTIPPDLPDGVRELINECFAPNAEDRPYFTDIVPRLTKISGIDAPPLVTDTLANSEIPSIPKVYIDDYVLNIDPTECKEVVRLNSSIPVTQKIRCMILVGEYIWITANGGLVSRYNNDGTNKKTMIIHKTGDESGIVLNIHSIVGFDNSIWGGAEDGSIVVWDADTCRERKRWKAHAPHVVKPLTIVHTAKARTVWSTSPIDKTIRVWDTEDYKMVTVVQSNKHPVNCLSQHQDFVWVGGNGDLFVYNSATFQLRGSWRAHDSSISCILSLGNRVWTGSATGDIKVWEDKAATELLLLKELKVHCAKILALCKYQTHHVWSCALDKSTLIWDSKNFIPVQEIADNKDSVSIIIRDGNKVWTAAPDKGIDVWEYVSRQKSSSTITGAAPRATGVRERPMTCFGLGRTTPSSDASRSAKRFAIGSSRSKS